MNYTAMQKKAQTMVSRYGAKCWIVKTESTYNKTTHQTVETETEYSGFGVVSSYDETTVNGSTIQLGDSKITFTPTEPVEPKTGDKVKVGTKVYNIISVVAMCPDGGTVIMYDIQVRA